MMIVTVLLCADCVGDAVDMGVCSSSSLTTAAAAASSGQLFMMNLLLHSLMDDNAGLEVALESAVTQELQVSVCCCWWLMIEFWRFDVDDWMAAFKPIVGIE